MTDLSPPNTLGPITPNTILAQNAVYSGLVYALQGTGGFSTTQGFATVHRLVETLIAQYDVTDSVEVLFDVRDFNRKLNLYKDASNIDISAGPVYYDSINDLLLNNSISLSAAEFRAGVLATEIVAERVISVGRYSTLYSDFAAYVAAYFGLPSATTSSTALGVATLFSSEYNLNPNGGVFDKAAFKTLMTASADVSGAYISTLTGDITISNITKLLRNAVDANPFGNRDPSAGTTAGDPSHRANYGVSDGFYANDLLFIPSAGINITLNLVIDSEGFPLPLNNMGPSFSSVTGASQDLAFGADTSTSSFSATSSATTILITRTLAAPLLLRLANISITPNV